MYFWSKERMELHLHSPINIFGVVLKLNYNCAFKHVKIGAEVLQIFLT
jgi:hypothetical protein